MQHMQQTSLFAYRDLENVNMKQKACYGVINKNGAACNYDIAHILKWDINRVTPRVLELREKGYIEEAYRDVNPATNRTVIYWKVR